MSVLLGKSEPVRDLTIAYGNTSLGEVTLQWLPYDHPNLSGYRIERSVNNGHAWTAQTTVVADLSGANWDPVKKRHFYTDATGSSGALYRVVAVLGDEEALPAYAAWPYETTLTVIYGHLVSLDGKPLAARDRAVFAHYVSGTTGRASVRPKRVATWATEQGFWSMDLLRGARVRFDVAGDVKEVVVPDDNTRVWNLVDLWAVTPYPAREVR